MRKQSPNYQLWQKKTNQKKYIAKLVVNKKGDFIQNNPVKEGCLTNAKEWILAAIGRAAQEVSLEAKR